MRRAAALCLILALAFVIVSCVNSGKSKDKAEAQKQERIVLVYEKRDMSGIVKVWRDSQTGCEFLNTKAGNGEALALIPGTCRTVEDPQK